MPVIFTLQLPLRIMLLAITKGAAVFVALRNSKAAPAATVKLETSAEPAERLVMPRVAPFVTTKLPLPANTVETINSPLLTVVWPV